MSPAIGDPTQLSSRGRGEPPGGGSPRPGLATLIARPLAPDSGKPTLVTGFGVTTTATIGQELTARGLVTEVLSTGSNPSDTTITQAVAAATRSELVVVTTSQAWNQVLNPKQKDLVNALLQTGRPLIAVAVREPYDIAYFTAAPTYLTTYGFNPVSLRALVRVLFGEVNPSGKLPVTIPAADDPGRILFPYGFGLSYDR